MRQERELQQKKDRNTEEKDGCNRNASGRKTVPGQNQHKQRTYPQKTSGEEKNGICPERHLFNSTAVCRTVSRLLAGTDGNPAYGGDKHGGRAYPSSDYRASVISLVLMQEGSLLVTNIAVVCSLFFFCNFPGGNGFRFFQQEHLLADRSSGGVHFNGMYAYKKSSK